MEDQAYSSGPSTPQSSASSGETVFYADGTSATSSGPDQLPDHSPSGSPEVRRVKGRSVEEKPSEKTPAAKERDEHIHKAVEITAKRRDEVLASAETAQREGRITVAHLEAVKAHHAASTAREGHLALNPLHRTQVDNNPVKVIIHVNKMAYTMPPGPFTVGEFKRMVNKEGIPLWMQATNYGLVPTVAKRAFGAGPELEPVMLGDDAELIALEGGESFFSGAYADDFGFERNENFGYPREKPVLAAK